MLFSFSRISPHNWMVSYMEFVFAGSDNDHGIKQKIRSNKTSKCRSPPPAFCSTHLVAAKDDSESSNRDFLIFS